MYQKSSKNMILYDWTTAMNPNVCISDISGAGRLFTAKRKNINAALRTNGEDDKMENN